MVAKLDPEQPTEKTTPQLTPDQLADLRQIDLDAVVQILRERHPQILDAVLQQAYINRLEALLLEPTPEA